MQELFSQLEIEHPNLFNTNTLEGRKFINDYYKFFELEKEQIEKSFSYGYKYGYEYDLSRNGVRYYKETFKLEL